MQRPLKKTLGPIGRPRYRWVEGFTMAPDSELYDEILASAKSMNFRVITQYDYGDHKEFTIESKTDDDEALFILTWNDYMNVDQYEHDKVHAFPADWITVLLYYTVRTAERSFLVTLISTLFIVLVPVLVSSHFKNPAYGILSLLSILFLLVLVLLRAYDDYRRMDLHKTKLMNQDII